MSIGGRTSRTGRGLNLSRWMLPGIIAALAATLTAAVGATITLLGPWYRSLTLPDWAPPDMAYGPAWTLIFALCAISGATAWRAAPDQESGDTVIGLFALNGFLNLLWSFLFFRIQRPDWAAVEVWFLWTSILILILYCWRFSRTSSLLFLPYLAWVSFAGALNIEVVKLNGPFG